MHIWRKLAKILPTSRRFAGMHLRAAKNVACLRNCEEEEKLYYQTDEGFCIPVHFMDFNSYVIRALGLGLKWV